MKARDGDEAVARLEEFRPRVDLVLSDVIVPNIGTIELAQRSARFDPTSYPLYVGLFP
jgi:CheY-like chemotaxis protein